MPGTRAPASLAAPGAVCEPAPAVTSPVRVCLLIGRYRPDFSGHGIHVERLIPHLRRAGVEPRVLTRAPAEGVAWAGEDAEPVARILPPGPSAGARLRRVVRLRRALPRIAGQADVLHSSVPDWEFFLNLPRAKRLGLPVVFEMVLLDADDPLAIRRQRFGAFKLRRLRHADRLVGITEAFGPRVEAAGLDPSRFRCVHMSVDVERYRPADPTRRRALRARFGLPAEARVVVSVGALMPRKGFDRLLAAWARLRPEPGRDLLWIVGPRAEAEGLRPQYLAHVEALARQAADAGLEGCVRFAGRLDEVHDAMAAADVFAFLSRREGFGTVTVEAMACGLPVLVSPLDGIAREILADGREGLVADAPDDPEAVAAALRELLDDPGRRARLGAAAREAACARFSMRARAEALAGIYRELAGR